MNQLSVRMTMGEQVLRLLICCLVLAQIVVIYEAVTLLAKSSDNRSYLPSGNPWARQLGDITLVDGSLTTNDLVRQAHTASHLFKSHQFAKAEPLYKQISDQLALRLRMNPEADESAITSAIIRQRAHRLTSDGPQWFNIDAYYVEAQVLTELGEIERQIGKHEDAQQNLAKAAAIYRELQVKTTDRVACLKGLMTLMQQRGYRSGAEMIEDELSGIAI